MTCGAPRVLPVSSSVQLASPDDHPSIALACSGRLERLSRCVSRPRPKLRGVRSSHRPSQARPSSPTSYAFDYTIPTRISGQLRLMPSPSSFAHSLFILSRHAPPSTVPGERELPLNVKVWRTRLLNVLSVLIVPQERTYI
jgi:hypothetical protein